VQLDFRLGKIALKEYTISNIPAVVVLGPPALVRRPGR